MAPRNRRGFLGAAAAGGLAARGILRGVDPDRKIAMARIGAGWYGMVDAKGVP